MDAGLNGQFVKGKSQILTEYQRSRRKLGNAVAGRGFSFEPGFMYDAQNELEIDIKNQISELNYKLLEASLASDLKQYGLDMDLAFKNAVIAWELEKQVLVTELDKEIQDTKQIEAHQDELLKILAIQVSLRGNALIKAKTAIELEAEAIRKQIAELDGTTTEYELLLAQAKLLTAEKKLEVIPYIQQIIEIERDIIEKDKQLVYKDELIVEAMQDIIDKEYEIVDKNQELVNRQNEIVTAELGLIGVQQRVVGALEDKLDDESDLITAEQAYIAAKETLITPVLEALITKMEEYVSELVIQRGIYDEISVIKTSTVGINERLAAKEEEILETKRRLIDVTTEFINASKGAFEYKSSRIAPETQALVAKTEEYINELANQQTILDNIANEKKQTANIKKEINGEEKFVIEAKTTLVSTVKAFIELQRGILLYKTNVIPDAVKDLLSKTEEYLLELTTQQEIYARIADIKNSTASVNAQIAAKAAEIESTKSVLISAVTDLVNLTSSAYDYKYSTIYPATINLFEGYGTYREALAYKSELKASISNIKTRKAGLESQKVSGEISIDDAELEQELERASLESLISQISALRNTYQVADANSAVEYLSEFTTKADAFREALKNKQEENFNSIKQLKKEIQTKKFNIEIDNKTGLEEAGQSAIQKRRVDDINRAEDETAIKTSSKGITAMLNHLIGQG